jgi:hypothetical protein
MRDVTPETIIRKRTLIDAIEGLLADPRSDNDTWASALRENEDERDSIEKNFAPNYDRARFVPTRDTYIRDVRERYAELWDALSSTPMTGSWRPSSVTPLADVLAAHSFVKADRGRLRFPLESARAEMRGVVCGVAEEPRANATADPLRVDPEVLEPADVVVSARAMPSRSPGPRPRRRKPSARAGARA